MLSLTQSLTALEESSFFLLGFRGFALWWTCQAHSGLVYYWGGGLLLPVYLLWLYRTRWFLWMEKPVRGYLGQHVNINIGLKYILKSKNACKYFSGLGPNKHGKGSYNILYVNKPLVVLGRTIHLSVFLKGTPGDHLLLYYCQQCHR